MLLSQLLPLETRAARYFAAAAVREANVCRSRGIGAPETFQSCWVHLKTSLFEQKLRNNHVGSSSAFEFEGHEGIVPLSQVQFQILAAFRL